jgi:hypothetical protein
LLLREIAKLQVFQFSSGKLFLIAHFFAFRPIRTLPFRSYDQILKSDEADLIESVCLDIDRAPSELMRTQAARQRPSGADGRAVGPADRRRD